MIRLVSIREIEKVHIRVPMAPTPAQLRILRLVRKHMARYGYPHCRLERNRLAGRTSTPLPTRGWPEAALTEVPIPADGVGELHLVLPTLARLKAARCARY